METTLSIQINNFQIIDLLKQLNFNDRISILKEFSDDWVLNILGLHEPEPLTIEEYNSKLALGLKDYEEGRTIKHEDLIKSNFYK